MTDDVTTYPASIQFPSATTTFFSLLKATVFSWRKVIKIPTITFMVDWYYIYGQKTITFTVDLYYITVGNTFTSDAENQINPITPKEFENPVTSSSFFYKTTYSETSDIIKYLLFVRKEEGMSNIV